MGPLSAVSAAVLLLLAGQNPAATNSSVIQATLAAVRPVFSSPNDVRVRLLLENSSPDCVGLFVDPPFSSIESRRRPLTLVRLTVTDQAGRELQPTSRIDAQHAWIGLHELVLLECGTSYGRELLLARIPWSYSLTAGRYRVRAQVKIMVGSFIRARGLVSQLRQLWRFTEEMTEGMLRDATAESNEVFFEITGP